MKFPNIDIDKTVKELRLAAKSLEKAGKLSSVCCMIEENDRLRGSNPSGQELDEFINAVDVLLRYTKERNVDVRRVKRTLDELRKRMRS